MSRKKVHNAGSHTGLCLKNLFKITKIKQTLTFNEISYLIASQNEPTKHSPDHATNYPAPLMENPEKYSRQKKLKKPKHIWMKIGWRRAAIAYYYYYYLHYISIFFDARRRGARHFYFLLFFFFSGNWGGSPPHTAGGRGRIELCDVYKWTNI